LRFNGDIEQSAEQTAIGVITLPHLRGDTAKTKGSGWVDYWLPKPGATEPSQKWSYVKAVKADGIALVGAGFYPD